MVVFAHGSGSSRKCTRSNYVAKVIRQRELGTLFCNLLTEEDGRVQENRFDTDLLPDGHERKPNNGFTCRRDPSCLPDEPIGRLID